MKKFTIIAVLAAGLTAAVCFADPAANEVDYVSQLPAPNDLMNKGVPDGARVAMIAQTDSEVTVTYAFTNGETRVVTYRPLPAAGSTATTGSTPIPTVVTTSTPTPATPAPAPVYVESGQPYTVVYEQPAPVYYYPANYGYYYPWFWPVSVGFGFHDRFGFRGDFRGGWGGGWHGGGGWRR